LRRLNKVVIAVLILILLSLSAISQIPGKLVNVFTNSEQVTANIAVKQDETCTTEFYEEGNDVYGTCTKIVNSTSCTNSTGPNTGCTTSQEEVSYGCITGVNAILRNKTQCSPEGKYLLEINDGSKISKKQLDFGQWGACKYENENNCLIVICVAHDDGAFKGQFTDCKGGKSCQRFEVCDGSLRVFVKNSREDFVEEDPSFYLPKLGLKEVGE